MGVIETISLAGFGSYGPKPQTLTLGGRGPLAIIGDNGAGKSTAVSKGLTWALYGKCPPERMGSGTRALTGRAVVGTGQKSTTVRVTLTDTVGALWTVVRSRGLTGRDQLEVNRDGEDLTDATQATIDALVGADYDTWCRTVVRGQGDPWSFAEATDARKREILDVISGASLLGEIAARAREKRLEAENEHRTLELDIAGTEAQIARYTIEATRQARDDWDRQFADRIEVLSEEIEALKTAEAEAREHDSSIGDNRAKRQAICDSEPEIDRAAYDAAIKLASDAYNAANTAFTVQKRDVDRLSSLGLGDPCPTCTQPVGTKVVETLSAARSSMVAAQDEVTEATAHLDECRSALKGAQAWLDAERAAWKRRLADTPAVQPMHPAAKREREHAEQRLSDMKGVVNPYVARLELEQSRLADLTRELRIARHATREAAFAVDAARAWEAALGSKGARAHMAEATIAAIETAANRWLSVLSDRPISVEFPPTREVKGKLKDEIKTIVHMEGVTRDLLSFSGGERRRVNLAVDLGVAAACGGGGLSLSLLVLDEEVFSGMDEDGKAAVVQALHGAGVADVVIIDHDPRLSSTLPRTIQVRRDSDGFSIMEEL